MRHSFGFLSLLCVATPVFAQEAPTLRISPRFSRAIDIGGNGTWRIDEDTRNSNTDPLEYLEKRAAYTPVRGMRGIEEQPLPALNTCHYGLARLQGAPRRMVELTRYFCLEGLRAAFACGQMAQMRNECGSLRQKNEILLQATKLPLSDADRAELARMAASIAATVREMLREDHWKEISKLTGCDLLAALRDFVKSSPSVSEEQLADFDQMLKPLPVHDQAFMRKAMASRPRTAADAPAPVKAAYSLRVLREVMVTYRPAGDSTAWKEAEVAAVESNLLCLGDEGDAPDQLALFRKTWAAEKSCRADEDCMDRRTADANAKSLKRKIAEVTESICDLRASIAETKRQIAEEHRYAKRTGVLSLSDLQELKENLRLWEETLAEQTEGYRMLVGRSAKVSCK